MKTNRTNTWIKSLLLGTALLISISINSQQLIAEYMINEPSVEINTNDIVLEMETVELENWMNEPNWLIDSSKNAPELDETINVEAWMAESFENAQESAIEMEEWMEKPFEVNNIAKEESIKLEDWMLDVKQW